jgi:hypothetical protein
MFIDLADPCDLRSTTRVAELVKTAKTDFGYEAVSNRGGALSRLALLSGFVVTTA